MFARIRAAVEPYPKAALFELRDLGYSSVFEQICACILSIRTLDETSLRAAIKLFEIARTPEQILDVSEADILERIHDCTFARQKAPRIRQIARIAIELYNGELPSDFAVLTSLPGVGPKCANLALGVAGGIAAIGVDVHVHRVSNRWGYVNAVTPEKTRAQLEAKLPRSNWVEINELLVPFGKHICTGRLPKCSTCPVLEYCQQVGVARHR